MSATAITMRPRPNAAATATVVAAPSPDDATVLAVLVWLNRRALASRFPGWRPTTAATVPVRPRMDAARGPRPSGPYSDFPSYTEGSSTPT